jgi:hypothetical protein
VVSLKLLRLLRLEVGIARARRQRHGGTGNNLRFFFGFPFHAFHLRAPVRIHVRDDHDYGGQGPTVFSRFILRDFPGMQIRRCRLFAMSSRR